MATSPINNPLALLAGFIKYKDYRKKDTYIANEFGTVANLDTDGISGYTPICVSKIFPTGTYRQLIPYIYNYDGVTRLMVHNISGSNYTDSAAEWVYRVYFVKSSLLVGGVINLLYCLCGLATGVRHDKYIDSSKYLRKNIPTSISHNSERTYWGIISKLGGCGDTERSRVNIGKIWIQQFCKLWQFSSKRSSMVFHCICASIQLWDNCSSGAKKYGDCTYILQAITIPERGCAA